MTSILSYLILKTLNIKNAFLPHPRHEIRKKRKGKERRFEFGSPAFVRDPSLSFQDPIREC